MSAPPARPRRAPADTVRDAVVDAGVGLAVASVLLAGLARPGFPLLRDWVATPTPPLSDAALGLGESAARAVPQDVALVWATRALDAVGLPVWPLTGLLTLGFCVWLAVAAGALVRRAAPGGPAWWRLPAVVAAVWNPFVAERLLQGHWSLLAGVAAAATMPVLLARSRPRVAAAGAAVVAAGLTPTGWVLAVVSAAASLGCADRPGRLRATALLVPAALVSALPWLLATVLTGGVGEGPVPVGATGAAEFAARAETGIGTLGSVVALGGIWNSAAVPASRSTWWAAAALVLLVAVWALAAPGLWRSRRVPVVRVTMAMAVVTWLWVALAATGPGTTALDAVIRAVPAAGLLRDTQKFVALALPATVLAYAFAARALSARLTPPVAALVATAVVVAAVPDAPRALWTSLGPVTYGAGWTRVAEIVAGEPGDVLVLPAGSFRSTPLWAGGAAVLDPAPRMLDARVLVAGDLVVGGAPGGPVGVGGEGARARVATARLLRGEDPDALAELGVRWVLDERTSAGPRGEAARTLRAAATRYSDPELVLYELAPPGGRDRWTSDGVPPAASQAARAAVLLAHAAWLATGLAAAAVAGVGALRVRRSEPSR